MSWRQGTRGTRKEKVIPLAKTKASRRLHNTRLCPLYTHQRLCSVLVLLWGGGWVVLRQTEIDREGEDREGNDRHL